MVFDVRSEISVFFRMVFAVLFRAKSVSGVAVCPDFLNRGEKGSREFSLAQ